MIHLSLFRLLLSAALALLFGVLAAAFGALLSIFMHTIKLLPSLLRNTLFYRGRLLSVERGEFLPKPGRGGSRVGSEVRRFFKIVAFTLGFLLLSYLALDGMIRVYMLALSLAALFFARRLFSKTLLPFVEIVSVVICHAAVVFFRLILLLPRRFLFRRRS